MAEQPESQRTAKPRSDTIERLYGLWILSTALLVLLVALVALFGRGQLRRHADALSSQTLAIAELQSAQAQRAADLARIRVDLDRLSRAPAKTPQTPPELRDDEPSPAPAQKPSAPTNAASLTTLLERALRPSATAPFELADEQAASDALDLAKQQAATSTLAAADWHRLAIVAMLLRQEPDADAFAARATAAGEPPLAYLEMNTRRLLVERRNTEAAVYANRLVRLLPDSPLATLLLAEALCANNDIAAADEAIESIQHVEDLAPADRIGLGEVLVALERWDQLERLVSMIPQTSAELAPKLNRLRAIVAIQQRRLPEALAIIDNLLVDQPTDYDLRTWRGVALLNAGQLQAARDALTHVKDVPDRPEAWFWLGMAEVQANRPDEAIAYLEHALTASQRYAPAWEALAALALNRGDFAAARQNARNAIDANPRRASAHFLLAITSAKLSDVDGTATALAEAIRLDPSMAESAKKSDAIVRLLSSEGIDALAEAAGPTTASEPDAAGEPE